MDVSTAIKSRRSIRKYQQKEIPKEVIDKLKEALIWAPSAGNLQARKFIFVYGKEMREKLSQGALGQEFIAECPLVVICCADLDKISSQYGDRGKSIYAICDVSASIENMMLSALEEGLGLVG
jgi:nitroreductase